MSGKLIRDAVYGDIHLGALEIDLINTPEFQRLRALSNSAQHTWCFLRRCTPASNIPSVRHGCHSASAKRSVARVP